MSCRVQGLGFSKLTTQRKRRLIKTTKGAVRSLYCKCIYIYIYILDSCKCLHDDACVLYVVFHVVSTFQESSEWLREAHLIYPQQEEWLVHSQNREILRTTHMKCPDMSRWSNDILWTLGDLSPDSSANSTWPIFTWGELPGDFTFSSSWIFSCWPGSKIIKGQQDTSMQTRNWHTPQLAQNSSSADSSSHSWQAIHPWYSNVVYISVYIYIYIHIIHIDR